MKVMSLTCSSQHHIHRVIRRKPRGSHTRRARQRKNTTLYVGHRRKDHITCVWPSISSSPVPAPTPASSAEQHHVTASSDKERVFAKLKHIMYWGSSSSGGAPHLFASRRRRWMLFNIFDYYKVTIAA